MVVVSHLFLFLGDKFRGRCDSHESHLPLCGTIYFPTAPFFVCLKGICRGHRASQLSILLKDSPVSSENCSLSINGASDRMTLSPSER